MALWIPGDPVPQPRPRFCRTGRRCHACGHPSGPIHAVSSPDDAPITAWREQIHLLTGLGVKKALLPKAEGAASLVLSFFLKRPKTQRDWPHPIRRPDCSNLAKAVEDAVEGVLFDGDEQIVRLVVEKAYAEGGETGVEIELTDA